MIPENNRDFYYIDNSSNNLKIEKLTSSIPAEKRAKNYLKILNEKLKIKTDLEENTVINIIKSIESIENRVKKHKFYSVISWIPFTEAYALSHIIIEVKKNLIKNISSNIQNLNSDNFINIEEKIDAIEKDIKSNKLYRITSNVPICADYSLTKLINELKNKSFEKLTKINSEKIKKAAANENKIDEFTTVSDKIVSEINMSKGNEKFKKYNSNDVFVLRYCRKKVKNGGENFITGSHLSSGGDEWNMWFLVEYDEKNKLARIIDPEDKGPDVIVNFFNYQKKENSEYSADFSKNKKNLFDKLRTQ